MDVFVARQAIFDRVRQLYGYELLFRSSGERNEFDGSAHDSATMQVIANSLLSIGLENLVCGKKAFVNFDRAVLMSGLHSMIPPGDLVVEILESVEPDRDLLSACRELRRQGYMIALDDFVRHPRFEPLTEIAGVIKVDMRATPRSEQDQLLRTYKPRGIAMLAEKVETSEEFDWARSAGYDLFQGYFFTRPVVVRGQQIPAAKLVCVQLLRELQRPELDFARLRELISRDVSLSYKLLRYVNSALFQRLTEIHAIDQALALLGESSIRSWAAVAALPELARDKPGELVTLSLVRARFCQHLAELAGFGDRHLAFLMGLFSLLDALLGLPLGEALSQAGVEPVIRRALLGEAPGAGEFGDIYRLVLHYESGDWAAVGAAAAKLGVQHAYIGKAYAESTSWADNILRAASRRADSRREVRHAADGQLQIRWQDLTGQSRTSDARLVNISTGGMQLLLAEPIHVSAGVAYDDSRLGISGSGTVRYCSFSKGRYLTGIEFTGARGGADAVQTDSRRRGEAGRGPRTR
jgi:EAL and modified HD-GYP domain-containing signal transduction protein